MPINEILARGLEIPDLGAVYDRSRNNALAQEATMQENALRPQQFALQQQQLQYNIDNSKALREQQAIVNKRANAQDQQKVFKHAALAIWSLPPEQRAQAWQTIAPGLNQNYDLGVPLQYNQEVDHTIRAHIGSISPQQAAMALQAELGVTSEGQKPLVAAPGSAVFRPGEYEPAYTVPSKETAEDRIKPTGQPFEAMANGKPVLLQQFSDGSIKPVSGYGPKPPRSSGFSIQTNPDGTVILTEGDLPGGMTKPTRTKEEQEILGAQDSLAKLRELGPKIAGDYLTYVGRGRAMIGELQDKFGQQGGNVDFNANRSAALQDVELFFNQYRKSITGAAAAEKEIQDLKKAVINSSIGPQEFQARYDALITSMENDIARGTRRLGGVPGEGKKGAQKSVYDPATDSFIAQ